MSSLDSRRRGAVMDDILYVLQSSPSSPSSLSLVQVGTHQTFLDQWISITSNWFVLNMVKVTILSLSDTLHYSIISNGLMQGLLWLNILLSRRGG